MPAFGLWERGRQIKIKSRSNCKGKGKGKSKSKSNNEIVPTLCVGMPPGTLCVPLWMQNLCFAQRFSGHAFQRLRDSARRTLSLFSAGLSGSAALCAGAGLSSSKESSTSTGLSA